MSLGVSIRASKDGNAVDLPSIIDRRYFSSFTLAFNTCKLCVLFRRKMTDF